MSPTADKRVPAWTARLERFSSGFSAFACYLSGATFLLLSFYITYDVLARKFGWPYSGVTDDMSSYGMAFAAAWSMAYALVIGGHIRIDLILPYLSRRLRDGFDLAALATLAMFAGMIAYYSWGLAMQSLDIDARSVSILQAPLVIPQGLMALGFAWFMIQTIVTIICSLVRLAYTGETGLVPEESETGIADVSKPLGDV
jgi:TRAP-type C4-dicarboxylate transport system permease small subunit